MVRSVFEIVLYLCVVGYVFAWNQLPVSWVPTLEDGATDQPVVSPELPYLSSPVSSEDASVMLSLLNLERVKQGMTLLRLDSELSLIAEEYSTAMLQRGFFSHGSPEGSFASDRLRERGIPWRFLAENIARSTTLRTAHNDLMNSPPHRANILRKEFRRVGIGVADGGIYGKIFTQIFRD